MHRCLFIGLLIITSADCDAAEGGIELSAKQLDPIPAPYQAAVIRLSIHNVGPKTIHPLYVDNSCNLSRIRKPGSAIYGNTRGSTLRGDRPKKGTLLDERNRLVPLILRQDEESSVHFSCAAEWYGQDGVTVLFSEAGDYSLQFKWFLPFLQSSDLLGEPTNIVVRRPVGDEIRILKILQENLGLVAAVLSPCNIPKEETLPLLDDIVTQYPESSYADYARFALARWESRQALASLKHAAIIHLEQIDMEHFAYGPEALALWRRILASAASQDAQQVASKLDQLFPNSVTRFEDLAKRLSEEEWIRLNPRAPEKREE